MGLSPLADDHRTGQAVVGTCGWHYRHWIGPFYPAGTRPAAFLAHYAERFCTVEVDNSFYRLPAPETLRRWRRQTPAGRFITHTKK